MQCRCAFEDVLVEIQAGEGGGDSKLFVHDLMAAYAKWARANNMDMEIVDVSESSVAARVTGQNAWPLFRKEGGKHCVQRVPPTERNGRRQTSMVGVMVTRASDGDVAPLNESEIDYSYCIGTGPGGQHRQKTASCVRAKHRPTGVTVVIDGRNQHQNKRLATRILSAKVREQFEAVAHQKQNAYRKKQWGGGGRSDKIRTYNFIESRAVDHVTGAKTRQVKEVIGKGRFDLLA